MVLSPVGVSPTNRDVTPIDRGVFLQDGTPFLTPRLVTTGNKGRPGTRGRPRGRVCPVSGVGELLEWEEVQVCRTPSKSDGRQITDDGLPFETGSTRTRVKVPPFIVHTLLHSVAPIHGPKLGGRT